MLPQAYIPLTVFCFLALVLLTLAPFQVAAAGKFVDGAVVPRSTTHIAVTRFAPMGQGAYVGGLLLPSPLPGILTPCSSLGWPSCIAVAGSGVAKCRSRLEIVPHLLPWYARRALPTPNLECRSWAVVGTRLRFDGRRSLRRVVCRGHLVGHGRADTRFLNSPGCGLGDKGLFARARFAIHSTPEGETLRLETIKAWASQQNLLVAGTAPLYTLLDGGFEWSCNHVADTWTAQLVGTYPDPYLQAYTVPASKAERALLPFYYQALRRHSVIGPEGSSLLPLRTPGISPPEPTVFPNRTYYVFLFIETGWVTPTPVCSVSDTDLDFYSGDYGAYFDSLEIELEPVKKSAKS